MDFPDHHHSGTKPNVPPGLPFQPPNRPALLEAVDLTVRTIEARAGRYRNLVVAVSAVSFLSTALALIFRHWIALSGLILLVPLTGGFLFFDSRLIRRWRSAILEGSASRVLDIAVFKKTISGFRYLPANSLKAMLSTLSFDSDAFQGQAQEQKLIGEEYDDRARKHERKILGTTGLLTLTLSCLAASLAYHSLVLLFCGAGIMVLLAFFKRR